MKLYLKVILCCLLAPLIHLNLSNLFIYGVDLCMGFQPIKVTYFGVLGCYTQTWMYLVINSASLTKSILLLTIGYKLSQHSNINYKLIGASFLCMIPFGYAEDLFMYIFYNQNPFSSWALKESWKQDSIIIFNTYYNYKLVLNSISLVYSVTSLYLCYKIVSYHWPTQLRLLMFTLGILASATSVIIWYLWLGPILY